MELTEKDRFPFPVLLDEDLAAVKRLGIAAQLASPSTFIIDKQGQGTALVRRGQSDRPALDQGTLVLSGGARRADLGLVEE